jgi:hypothetical protein
MGWKDKAQLIVLTHSNSCSDRREDGRYVDIFFDELLISSKLTLPAYVVENPSNWGHLSPTLGPRHLFEEVLILASMMLARTLEVRKTVQAASERLTKLLVGKGLPLPDSDVNQCAHKALASFEAKRRIYGRFFRHRSCKSVFVLNWIGVMGQVAAAKEMNIPVFDFQHGGMEKGSIGYHWDPSLKPAKRNIPLPDTILVYGKLWKEALLHEGFWGERDIVPAGSARMDRFRKKRDEIDGCVHAKKVSLLFTTQWTTRADAISFWRAFLERAKADSSFAVRLIVKVHPFEKGARGDYGDLEKEYSDLCKVIFDEDDTFSLMLKSHIHISYYSTSLLESLALGIPSVSICRGSAAPQGIAGIRPIPRLRNSIVHLDSVKALIAKIRDNLPGSNNMKTWRRQTVAYGNDLFTPGFIANASRAINSRFALTNRK